MSHDHLPADRLGLQALDVLLGLARQTRDAARHLPAGPAREQVLALAEEIEAILRKNEAEYRGRLEAN